MARNHGKELDMAGAPKRIASLEELTGNYAAIFSDVWGVLHNGERAFAQPAAGKKPIDWDCWRDGQCRRVVG